MEENISNNKSPSGEETLELPEALKSDLRKVCQNQTDIPLSLDDEILNRAQAHFAGINQTRRSSLLLHNRKLKWIAAAVCIALVSIIAVRIGVLRTNQPALAGDIDNSGNVDILDAFALARHIEAKALLKNEWDVNADGTINAGDVQFIATKVVSISDKVTASTFNEIDDTEQFAILLEGRDL